MIVAPVLCKDIDSVLKLLAAHVYEGQWRGLKVLAVTRDPNEHEYGRNSKIRYM